MIKLNYFKQRLALLRSKKLKHLCVAKPDVFPLRKKVLIQELCKTHSNSHKDEIGIINIPTFLSWSNNFLTSAHLLESYMLLHHHKEAKRLLFKFRMIDPDRTDGNVTENVTSTNEEKDIIKNLEEASFLTQFAFVLKEAGFEEIPQYVIKQCIENSQKYDKIELEVQHKDYLFIRFWVFGQREVEQDRMDMAWKPSFEVEKSKRILHERVVVASRSKNSTNMILKGFKDVPLDHLESLLPEAKIKLPRGRKWLFNTSLTITGLFAFFNFGMIILTEFRMNLIFVLMLFTGVVAYRISEKHKTQKNKHVLALKRMLYYKSTANNSGLVLDVVNKAHERLLKEVLIVYGTALIMAEKSWNSTVTEQQLTDAARQWISKVCLTKVEKNDINFAPAIAFLQQLGLLSLHSHKNEPNLSSFRVIPSHEAAQSLLLRIQEIAAD